MSCDIFEQSTYVIETISTMIFTHFIMIGQGNAKYVNIEHFKELQHKALSKASLVAMCKDIFHEDKHTFHGPLDKYDMDLQCLCSMRKTLQNDRQQLINVIQAAKLNHLGLEDDKYVLAQGLIVINMWPTTYVSYDIGNQHFSMVPLTSSPILRHFLIQKIYTFAKNLFPKEVWDNFISFSYYKITRTYILFLDERVHLLLSVQHKYEEPWCHMHMKSSLSQFSAYMFIRGNKIFLALQGHSKMVTQSINTNTTIM